MKRIAYSLLLFLALCPASGFAQGRWMYGVNAGINTGYRYEVPVDFPSASPYTTRWAPGFHTAFEFGYYNWNVICITMNLEYNQRNYRDQGFIWSDDFLEIPILIKIPVMGKNPRLYLIAGPNFGIHYPIDIGIVGGIGITTALTGRTDFFFQTEYIYGFNELIHPAYTYELAVGAKPFALYTNYSREIRITLGVLFGKE